MSSFFCLTADKSEDPVLENRRSSFYESVFTYNTERQFCNYYNAFPHDDLLKNQDKKDDPTFFKILEMLFMVFSSILVIFTLPFSLFFAIKFISPYERLVVMRLGKANGVRGPGTVFVFPFVDKAVRIDIRVQSFELTFQIITADRGLAEVNVVVLSKVSDSYAYYCGIQNREETLRSLSHNIIHNSLMKKMLCDLTNPESLSQILIKAQEEFNVYCKTLGIEVTQISVTQLKIIKEGENQALSLFNTLLKSDLGTQLINQFGPQIKNFVTDNIKSTTNPVSFVSANPTSIEDPIVVVDNKLKLKDPDIECLIKRIRSCCDFQLVAKVKKYYRIRCLSETSLPLEFDINLRDGEGSCEWLNSNNNQIVPDVVFTLQKQTIFALMNNSISPLTAYLNGSVVINGNVTDAYPLKHLAERAKQIE